MSILCWKYDEEIAVTLKGENFCNNLPTVPASQEHFTSSC